MKSRIFIILITAICVLFMSVPNTNAATQAEIEASIVKGLAYLASQQNPDGSWSFIPGVPYPEYDVSTTALVVLKFEERAKELGKDPFNPADYEYANNVIAGLNYIFTYIGSDANGVHFPSFFFDTYSTGIAMMALSASNAPSRLIAIGPLAGLTYQQAVQGMMSWMAFAQNKNPGFCEDGGWGYLGPYPGFSDNSNSGYATIGIGFANASPPTGFGVSIPPTVLPGLNTYINNSQVTSGPYAGGSIYNPCWGMSPGWVNTLKTGNLLHELAIVGAGTGDPRVQNAINFIETYWNSTACNFGDGCGWMGDSQAMFTMMKGLVAQGVTMLTVGGNPIDWFDEVSTYIVNHQNPDGSWIDSANEEAPYPGIDTAWALLTLEKVVVPPVMRVFIDIKPGSCPNPLDLKNKGVLPVAVLGTADFDITIIDPSSIKLTREGFENVGVAPLRWAMEDVATPFEGELCGCHVLTGDGYLDLTFKFNAQALANTLNLSAVSGQTIKFILTGNLKEENGGTPINGQDCTRIK